MYHRMHRVHRVSISICAPHMGSDQLSSLFKSVNTEFQFTFPVWRAISFTSFKILYYFNSRFLHDGRLCNQPPDLLYIWDFNSRSPHGERPSHRVFRLHAVDFSIHVPRMRSDSARKVDMFSYKFFSRFPCGERLSISFKAPTILSFQFTLLE